MEFTHYLWMAVILAGGGALHSAAGFGYGLFSITLLLLLGLKPYEAIPIVTVATMLQGLTGVWYHRRELPWRLVGQCCPLVLIMIPVGVFLLGQITLLSPAHIQQVFGAIVLLMVVVYAVWQPVLRERIPWGWTAAAMLSSGLLAGLCGMAGPPLVLWAMTHRWSSVRTRVTLWALFLTMTPVGLCFLYQRFGTVVGQSALLAFSMTPAVLLGSLAGIWVGNRMPKPVLRRLAVFLLIVLAIYMVSRPWWLGNGELTTSSFNGKPKATAYTLAPSPSACR